MKPTVSILLQVITAAGLAIDARIHLKLAPVYDAIKSDTISQGDLFRVEGGLAILAAIAILISRKPIVAVFAASVAGGGLIPLFVYRYFDIGTIGPLPSMYEPAWFPDKTNTAIAQGVAALAALILVAIAIRTARRATTEVSPA